MAEHPLTAGLRGRRARADHRVERRAHLVQRLLRHDGGQPAHGERRRAAARRSRTAAAPRRASMCSSRSFAASFYTWPPVGGEPAELLTPQAETALPQRAQLGARRAAARRRGARHRPFERGRHDREHGQACSRPARSYPGRAGDGTFLVPLQPGTWTLEVSAFGHATTQRSVTVAAGDVAAGRGHARLATTRRLDRGPRHRSRPARRSRASRSRWRGRRSRLRRVRTARYRIDDVPVGDVRRSSSARRASGCERRPVTVAAGATTTVDVALAVSRVVAVAGDFQNRITTLPDRERLRGRPVELGGRPAARRRARRRRASSSSTARAPSRRTRS